MQTQSETNGATAQQAQPVNAPNKNSGAQKPTKGSTAKKQGVALDRMIPAVTPWASPVNGAQAISDATVLILNHTHFRHKDESILVALWALFTHCQAYLSNLEQQPYLNLTSATKRCGKTTLLKVVKALSNRPLSSADMSVAILKRVLNERKPTLCLDEVDKYLKPGKQGDYGERMRTIINAAHDIELRYCWMCDTENNNQAIALDCWTPIALVGIGNLPEDTLDRCISVYLAEAKNAQLVHWGLRDKKAFAVVQSQFQRWAQDNAAAVDAALYQNFLPSGTTDFRGMDNYRPLLAIAYVAGMLQPGTPWAQALETVFLRNAGERNEDEARPSQLAVAWIAKWAQQNHYSGYWPSQEICDAMNADQDEIWISWGRKGNGISPAGLKGLLKPYKIASKDARSDFDGKQNVRKCFDLDAIIKAANPQI